MVVNHSHSGLGLDGERVDYNSLKNLPIINTDYFIGTISFSASTGVITTATIASTTFVSNTSMVSGNTIVIQKEGVYQINTSCSWTGNATGVRKIYIYINNIRFDAGGQTVCSTSQELSQISTGNYLSVGDIVDVRVFQNSGGTLSSQLDANKFSVVQIS